jgi:DNA-directed RNA polymerase subunit RPC12/RpoP
MTAYKCDRCGKYFDPPLKRIKLLFGNGFDEYEVCPDCYKEVDGYLKNETYTAYADDKAIYSYSKEVMNELVNKKEE